MSEHKTIRFAVPTAQGQLCLHFGHCEQYAFFGVEDETVQSREDLDSPVHEPGLLPRWLKEKGADLVIAGGMGRRAQDLFKDAGVEVIFGAQIEDPKELVQQYLSGDLQGGANTCDH